MKRLLYALTIQAISASIITDHFQSLNSKHHHLAGIGNNRQKRQILDFNSIVLNGKCQAIIDTEECRTDGLIQELVNLSLKCNQTASLAQELRYSCVTNALGNHCGIAGLFLNTVTSIPTVCASSGGGNCTDDCSNLLMEIRNGLGCCISGTFNSSTSSLFQPSSFQYSLWSDCGVDTVEECPDNSGITIPPEVEVVDPNCDFLAESFRTICSQHFGDPIINALSMEDDCQIYTDVIQETCAVTEEAGHLCLELIEPLTAGFFSASSNCIDMLATCAPSCRSALENWDMESGCCLNTYNGTLFRDILNITLEFLSDEFWSLCGLQSPGFCPTQLNTVLIPDHDATTLSSDSIRTNPEDHATANTPQDGSTTIQFNRIDHSATLPASGSGSPAIHKLLAIATIITTMILMVIN